MSFQKFTVQGVQKQLQSRQALLTVDNGSLLHLPGVSLNLLEHHGAEEMRINLFCGMIEDPVRYAHNVGP
jgi:hypothetical protein